MRSRRYLILFFLLGTLLGSALFTIQSVDAQKSLAASTRPFEPIEELFYEAEFSRALLRGLNVAEFKFRSRRTPVSEAVNATSDPKPYSLTFNADVASKGFFARLFNLRFREQVESTVDGTSFTIQKTTILDEQGKRVRATETIYDRPQGKMSWTLRDPNNPTAEPRKSVTDFSGQLQDVLSAIYFIRTQPLKVGTTFEVFIGDGGRVYRVPVKVVEKRKMKTVVGKVEVVRVDPELFGPDRLIDDGKGQFTLWITDDDRHIPVSARIKSEYGTFDVKLKRAVYNSKS
ncbi:MAG TPA: DUF3108 domain-containing protein [Pyrinomonadaceae bacterium]|jgi:hypothetical protein|nr:DUF3108 domain-containing protein [Pyrinomonadaceae bacterium]